MNKDAGKKQHFQKEQTLGKERKAQKDRKERKKLKERKESYDNPWKRIIEKLFPDFLAFFFPDVHSAINWQHAPEFLNTELPKILRDADGGNRHADKIVKVRSKQGFDAIIVVHIEIQVSHDTNFARRMYVYNSRLSETFGDNVVSLAVLADSNANWKPQVFERRCLGSELRFAFSMVKLLELKERCWDADPQGNPFAWVVRAHLDIMATRKDPRARLERMKSLYPAFYAAVIENRVILELLIFFDWVFKLPRELCEDFDKFLGTLEANVGKPYIPRFARAERGKGVQEGIQQGIQQGRQQGRQQEGAAKVQRALEKRLNGSSGNYVASLSHLSQEEIDELFDFLLDTTDIEKIKAWFASHEKLRNTQDEH